MTWTEWLQRLGPPVFLLWAVALVAAFLLGRRPAVLGQVRYLVTAVLAIGAVPLLTQVLPILRHPYQLEFGEGYIVRAAWLLSNGRMLYGPWENPVGGIDALYPPLYFALLASLFRLFPPVILYARLISFAASLGTLAICGRIVWRRTSSPAATLATVLLPLCLPVKIYLLVARTDALAVVCSLAGLMVAMDGLRERGELEGRAWWGTLLLLLLATLAKQNFLAGAAAVTFLLLLRRRYAQAVRFAALYGGALAAVTAALSLATEGRYFFLIYRLPLHSPFSRGYLWFNLAQAYGASWLLALAAAAALWLHRRQPDLLLLLLHTALSALLSVSAGKLAALGNYFLEPSCLLAIGLGLAVASVSERAGLGPKASPSRVALAALLVAGCFWMSFAQRAGTLPYPDLAEARRASQALERRLDRIPGQHLASDPYLLFKRGQQQNTVEWFIQLQLTVLANSGKWQGPFLDDLRRGRYTAIVLRRYQLSDNGPAWRIGTFGKLLLGRASEKLPDNAPEWRMGAFTLAQAEVVQEHYRPLKREEYLPVELPSYDRFVILVPCREGCGVSTAPQPAPPGGVGPYRKAWWWLRDHLGLR